MNKRKVFFVHIPKTGGRSIESVITANTALKVCPSYDTENFLSLQENGQYEFYQGHLMFFLKGTIEPDFTFTILRSPIERSISALEHIARSPDHASHKFIGNKIDIKLALSTREIECHISNVMTKFLGLRPKLNKFNNPTAAFQDERINYQDDKLLFNAKRAIDEMDYIGFTELLNSNQEHLIATLGISSNNVLKTYDVNKNPNKFTGTYQERLSKSDFDLLYNANLLDIELFDYAKSVAREKGWLADESVLSVSVEDKLKSDSRSLFIQSLDALPEINSINYTFDMPLQGDGWHTRETDGNIYWRFTGPTASASVFFQKIRPESLTLKLHVFHAITPLHIDSLMVAYNGFKLERPERQGSVLVYMIPYEATLARNHTYIEFFTAPPQRPEYGDDRLLGIGFSCIEIY